MPRRRRGGSIIAGCIKRSEAEEKRRQLRRYIVSVIGLACCPHKRVRDLSRDSLREGAVFVHEPLGMCIALRALQVLQHSSAEVVLLNAAPVLLDEA